MEIEQQDSTEEFPDMLVAKIVSMVPFPYIAKIRGVSKTWRARFSASSSLDDETKRKEIEAFHRQVQERAATKWSTYFPVCVAIDFMCGFERESQEWVRFPCLSIPQEELRVIYRWWIDGALLFGESRREGAVYVVNLFTRIWKKSASLIPSTSLHNALSVWNASSETYKVISLQADTTIYVEDRSAQIYNAKSDVWHSTALLNQYMIPSFGIPVQLNGVLYKAIGLTYLLHAFHVADETVSTVELSCPTLGLIELKKIYLVVCEGKLYMILTDIKCEEPFCVLEVDLQSLRLLQVATAPITLIEGEAIVEIDMSRAPMTDGSNCIFFLTVMPVDPGSRHLCSRQLPGTMVAYDIHTHQWTVLDFLSMMSEAFKYSDQNNFRTPRIFDWLSSSFQPGLNPFAEV